MTCAPALQPWQPPASYRAVFDSLLACLGDDAKLRPEDFAKLRFARTDHATVPCGCFTNAVGCWSGRYRVALTRWAIDSSGGTVPRHEMLHAARQGGHDEEFHRCEITR